jgi:putative serine protease PepD
MTETPDNSAIEPADESAASAPATAPATGPGETQQQQPDQAVQPQAPDPATAASGAEEQTAVLPPAPPTAEPAQQASHESAPQEPTPLDPAPFEPTPDPAVPAPTSAPAPAQWGAPTPTPAVQSAAGGAAPPNWAWPEAATLPAYGDGAGDPGAAQKRSGMGRAVLAAAIIAGLVGGGVGAGVTYALKKNDNSSSTSLSNQSSATSTLNTSSPNANQVTSVAAKVLPSVVTITVESSDGSGDEGSGIIISGDGEILTNNHVIAAAATSGSTMTVTFDSGKITPAKILGRDPVSDLAVIQAQGVSGLTKATLGSSTNLAVGQAVVAIGAPLGLSNTVTTGIVSALNRPVQPASDTTTPDSPSAPGGSSGSSGSSTTDQSVLDAIQTDAAINPGNSGGPLVDMSGDVIGINSAIATASSDSIDGSQSGSIGLGFAIPISQAVPIAQELIATGTASHSLLGVSVADPSATATQAGAVVKTVTAGGPAATAGIKVGDVITKVDSQQIGDADSLVAAVRSYQPNTAVTLTYVRGSQTNTAQVTLGKAPAGS